MRLWASVVVLLSLLLSSASARLKGHDGIYECYTTGTCELCSHEEMQARARDAPVSAPGLLECVCVSHTARLVQDAQTACKATGHHQAIQCLVTGASWSTCTAGSAGGCSQLCHVATPGPTLEDVDAAVREVNKRRVKEQRFTDTPLADSAAGNDQGDGARHRRRSALQSAAAAAETRQPQLVIRREADATGEDADAGQGQRGGSGRRRTVHTYQRCAVLAHEATGRALLRFEALSLVSAAASFGFVWHRKRQAMLRRGGGAFA